MYCVSRKEVSRTAVTILAALSISIGTATFANAKSSSHQHHHNKGQVDGELIAGFPFRKPKSDVTTDTAKNSKKDPKNDSDKAPDKDADKVPAKNPDKSSDQITDQNSDKNASKNSDKNSDKHSDKSASSDSDKAAAKNKEKEKKDKDKSKDKGKDKNKDKNASLDKKKAKADEKAAAKAQADKEDAEKEAAKLAKKEKKKPKDEKKVESFAEEKSKQNTSVPPRAATESGAASTHPQNRSGYTADSALISLLNDLARALKDPAEQAKLGDENQKFVVQMALDVLSKAIESRNDANRIVDKKSMTGNSMSAEAWSSGDVKVSNDCRGSLAAVWAKKENGLLNVTIAGVCGDKVAPCGKNVGEFVVVLSAHSSIQKGFDIQTQTDVTFWLAKLASVNVDAACCNTDLAGQDKTSSSVESDTRELKKNSTVVLQAIMTERERLFSNQKNDTQPTAENRVVIEEAAKTNNDKAEAQRQAKEQKAAAEAEQKRKEQQLKIAAAEKQRQLDEEHRRVEAESTRKLEEDNRRAEAESKRKLEEEDRRAEAEEKQKHEEEVRLAQAEKQQKAAEKQQKIAEKQHKAQAELSEKASDDARKNPHLSRADAILAEATRQAELEQAQGMSSSQNMTRDDAILAEATRQAELERREAADMRIPYNAANNAFNNAANDSNSSSNLSAIPSVEIDNQQTALRPTPSMSEQTSSAAPSEPPAASMQTGTALNGAPQAVADSRPPIQIAAEPSVNREPSKGWESPGLPVNVKQPSAGAKMVLPERAIAGQYITASVIDANHNGESGIELGFNGVSLATDPHGQVTFMVPEDAVPGNSLNVAMTGNTAIRPFSIEVLQPLTTSSQQEAPSIDRTSEMVSTNGTVIIDGHNFDGLADHNKVLIDEKNECIVTAASPVQLRATLPVSLVPGVHFATVYSKQIKSNPGRFNLVTAEVQADPKEAGKEQETKLVIKVLGTTNKVQVHLTNQSPDVIKISKGNDFRLITPGGDDNSTIVSVQRLRKGSYRVGAVVE